MIELLLEGDPSEVRELGSTVRRFAEDRFYSPPRLEPHFARDDFRAMGALGLTGMSVPEAHGGTALSSLAIAASIFELARTELAPAIYLSVHLMVARLLSLHGASPHLLRSLSTGEKLAAFCLSEPGAGSDAAALRTRAVRTGSEYTLEGEKSYITSGGEADVYLIFARTGSAGAKGISAFVVERGQEGIRFGPPEVKMGCEGSPITSVVLESCRVSAEARLGEEGAGYGIALSGLAGGRVNIAAAACGISARALELAIAHARERKQFGKAISELQGIQFMIADMYMRLAGSVHLARHAAAELDSGKKGTLAAATAKCVASDAAMAITTDAVQILGGSGYLRDFIVERLMRDAKMLQIVEGTNQIQRVLIARELLQDR